MSKTKKWALWYESCIKCHKTNIKHRAKGLCGTCYQRGKPQQNKIARYRQRFKIYNIFDSVLLKYCVKCHTDQDLVIHHKDHNQKNNEFNNLITLCRGCHNRLHRFIKLKKFFEGFEDLVY